MNKMIYAGLALTMGLTLRAETLVLARTKGFKGVHDTLLSKLYAERVCNGRGLLSVTDSERANPRCDRTLIRFDDIKLPGRAQIDKATLRLYADGNSPSKNSVGDPQLKIARMLTPWNDQTAQWKQSDTGKAWKQPGAGAEAPNAAAGVDLEQYDHGPAFATVTVPVKEFKPGYIEFDVTESLREMLQSGKNYGWIVYAESAKGENRSTVLLRDNEFGKQKDPQLVIEWSPKLPD